LYRTVVLREVTGQLADGRGTGWSKKRRDDGTPGACCKSKTGRHNQDRSRRSTNHRRILTRPVLIVATGLGFATRPWKSIRHPSLSRRCLRATDTRRDTGPWHCSSDGTYDRTRLIGRRYLDHKFVITPLIYRNSVHIEQKVAYAKYARGLSYLLQVKGIGLRPNCSH